MNDGIAKPEDFRRAYEQREQAVRIVLPKSGLAVLARKLSPLRSLMQSDEAGQLDISKPEDARRFSQLFLSTLKEALILPRFSLTPGPDEIDPNWLPQEDADFLFKWAVGLMTAEGEDLGKFFRESGPDVAHSPGGGDVVEPPERADGPGGSSGVPV